jgi:hypothetical protein
VQTLKNSCNRCRHHSKIGKKGFCFKHDKIPSTPAGQCNDFKQKTQPTPIKSLHHASSENEKSSESIEGEDFYEKDQKIILAVFGGGLAIILGISWAGGVL